MLGQKIRSEKAMAKKNSIKRGCDKSLSSKPYSKLHWVDGMDFFSLIECFSIIKNDTKPCNNKIARFYALPV